jgi:hypothetical protein
VKIGFFARRERWTLTWQGKLLLLAIALGSGLIVQWQVYPFLAVNKPVAADTLLVEGWISDYLLHRAAYEFWRGHYRRIIVARPLSSSEGDEVYAEGKEDGEYKAHMLIRYGVPKESVGTLFYSSVERDRTYHGALAVKKWFSKNGVALPAFNVATAGPHARRSWLLYQMAFGNTAEIGIVALTDPTYDPKHWWRTSEGVREVLGETTAYLYARFFFLWAGSSPD